jgi:monoamine oxidase
MNTNKILDDCRSANQQPKKITILGAGIAGLVAAYELEKLGHQVEILEGSPRIGGRVWTHRFGSGADAPYGELGAMRIHKEHQHTLHYVRELGLSDKLCKFITVFEEHKALINIQGKIFRIEDAARSFDRHYQGIFLATQYRDRTRHFAAWLKTIVDAIAPGDLRASFDRDLESHLMAELDCLDLEPYFSADGDTVNFHKFIKENPGFRDRCSKPLAIFLSDILVETSDDLLQLNGGMEQLIDRLATAITATIKCDREVVALAARSDSVEVSWLENGKLQTSNCDYVLCTIPFSVLKKLELTGFDDRKLASIHNTVYCPATKTILHCAEAFWEQEGIGGGASLGGEGIQQIYYPSIESHPDRGSVLLASYTIGKDSEHLDVMSDPQRCFYVRDWIGQIHPAINTPGTIVDAATMAWGNYRWSNGGCTIPWGGDLADELDRALQYLEAARPLNRLFFAGEHCSRFPAWMQGSIESALEAIYQIVSHQPIELALTPNPSVLSRFYAEGTSAERAAPKLGRAEPEPKDLAG